MSESVFQNSGCVNTILGSMIHLSSFLPVGFPIRNDTTLNKKYKVLESISPVTVPKLQYFGIGTNGCYCTSAGSSSHVKYVPDARNMDIYAPVPLLVLTLEEDKNMSWAKKSQYRMRFVEGNYVKYYLKKIQWSTEEVEVRQINPNGTEEEFIFNDSYLRPTPDSIAQVGSGEVTSATRIVVRALGKCNVTYSELESTMNQLDTNYLEISEFGFYTGCEMYLDADGTPIYDPIPEDDNLIDGAACIEAAYVQLAKHKTQLPVTLQDENSSIETTVSFESSNSISI